MFSEAISNISEFLTHNPNYGNLVAGIFAFIESLAVIGSIIPGSVTMTAIGTLIGLNILPLVPILSWAIVGAMLGDLCSFYLGVYYQQAILNNKFINKYKHWVTKSEEFINKYGIYSIIIGRFFGPFRSMIPMVAGVLNMQPKNFIIAAIPACILWSIVYLSPGILIGAISVDFPDYIPAKIIAYILITMCLIIAIIKSSKYIRQPIKKYLLQVSIIAKSKNPMYMLLGTTYLIIFTILVLIVSHTSWAHIINDPTYALIQSLWQDYANFSLLFISMTADKKVLFATGVFSCGLLLINKPNRKIAIIWLSYIIISALIIKACKLLVSAARPPIIAPILGHTSFPSGHTAFITVFLSLIWLYTKDNMQDNFTKKAIKTFCFVWPVLIAFSRVYIGAHWLTDVIAAIFLGLAIAHLVYATLFYNYSFSKMQNYNIILTLVFWLGASVTYSSLYLYKYYPNYFPTQTTISITKHQLLTNNPVVTNTRDNKLGFTTDIINIRWLDSLDNIKLILKQQHWQCSNNKHNRLKNWLEKKQICSLPIILPKLQNKDLAIAAIKKINKNQTAVVLIWPSNFNYNQQQLWLGSIYVEDSNMPLSTIKQKNYSTQLLTKNANKIIVNNTNLNSLQSDNKILIIAPSLGD